MILAWASPFKVCHLVHKCDGEVQKITDSKYTVVSTNQRQHTYMNYNRLHVYAGDHLYMYFNHAYSRF